MSKVAHTAQGRISRFFDILGRSMIAAGLLLLSFVAYQLWGTGLSEGRAQNTLAAQFVTQQPTKPQFGGLVGRISIPSIGLSKFVVAGVRLSDLKKGPGLFAGSPLPGQLGNVAIRIFDGNQTPPDHNGCVPRIHSIFDVLLYDL